MNFNWFYLLMAFFYFIPAYLGNVAPVIFHRFGWFKKITIPIDSGRKIGGEKILGDHKTWMGFVAGIIGGATGGLIQMFILRFSALSFTDANLVVSGLWILMAAGMGFAAILGDMVKSFFKRRLKVKPGKPLLIFDQIDYLIGAYLYMLLLIQPNFLGFEFLWYPPIAIVISIPAHFFANVLAYKLGWKKVWW